MTNIQKALLSTVYPDLDIVLLQDIIDATPDPEMATEVLCGIYLEPKIPEVVLDKTSFASPTECTFISFNKWTKEITYRHHLMDYMRGFFKNEVDKDVINHENFDELKSPDNAPGRTMSLKKWLTLEVIDTFAQALDEAEKSIEEPHVQSHVEAMMTNSIH